MRTQHASEQLRIGDHIRSYDPQAHDTTEYIIRRFITARDEQFLNSGYEIGDIIADRAEGSGYGAFRKRFIQKQEPFRIL